MKVILLAGGSGTRLWPLSRERYPKQFIKLYRGNTSLFQDAFQRSLLLVSIEDIYIVTNQHYKFLVMGEIEELGYQVNDSQIIIEPEAKNTLPAIYAGVHEIVKKSHDLILVFPSDHVITHHANLVATMRKSMASTSDFLVTFGVLPDKPHTGYGYISPGTAILNGYQVLEFKEKPNLDLAEQYVKRGYYWNSGIVMFHSQRFLEEVRTHTPAIHDAFQHSSNLIDAFAQLSTNLSIDYGILEKSSHVLVVPVDFGWNDLGNFDAFFEVFERDAQNNIANVHHIPINSSNNVVYAESDKLIATVGVQDLIVIDQRDALLVCRKDESQKVKEIVEGLKKQKDVRAEYHLQDYRSWGKYQILEEEHHTYKIQKITLYPGKKLNYQLHHHRTEHLIVIKGIAKLTHDQDVKFIRTGESIFVKEGQKYRLENPGKIPLVIIEVQMGEYLKEDDSIRFD